MVATPPTEQRTRDDGGGQGAPRLVLASASPRRHELLAALGAAFVALPNDAEERDAAAPAGIVGMLPPAELPLAHHPALLAWRKARASAALAPGALVLGADTTVVVDGEVLNKPRDAAHARAMLARLSGRAHLVYTGLCLIGPGGEGRPALDLVASEVEFHPLGPEQIEGYIATGEPLDKAGAYGVQGLGGRLVRAVRGSYTNVVGLPLPAAHRLLTAAGIDQLDDPATVYRRWIESQGKEPLPCPPTHP